MPACLPIPCPSALITLRVANAGLLYFARSVGQRLQFQMVRPKGLLCCNHPPDLTLHCCCRRDPASYLPHERTMGRGGWVGTRNYELVRASGQHSWSCAFTVGPCSALIGTAGIQTTDSPLPPVHCRILGHIFFKCCGMSTAHQATPAARRARGPAALPAWSEMLGTGGHRWCDMLLLAATL